MVVLLELLAGGVLSQEQLGEILKAVNWAWQKGVEPIGGEDSTQDGVISGMNHYLVLTLAEVLYTPTGVAIKSQNHEFLRKFIF